MQLLYAVGLLGLYLVLLIGEFFLPTGGTLGIAAAVTAIAAIVVGFTVGPITGMMVTATILLSTPAILYAAVRLWPKTPIGRLILNRTPGQIDAPVESRIRGGERRKDLVGKIGTARTNLLPGGQIELQGQRLDAVSEGAPIDAGTRVIIISAVAGKLRVRPASETDQTSPAETPADTQPEVSPDIQETLDAFDLHDFIDDTEAESEREQRP
ncbi:NfeD family protein [Roseiconus lacunae]|uniref:NfeD family protein n=1 Tax=Roseiconus lacunae TaxID=2605694 RepID=A0ABT7PK81_9BACT|nr:NfeD family protein [Roseiconus lacunae]MDM4016591.1 NfeD family protein [Roseiconus lacunae]